MIGLQRVISTLLKILLDLAEVKVVKKEFNLTSESSLFTNNV